MKKPRRRLARPHKRLTPSILSDAPERRLRARKAKGGLVATQAKTPVRRTHKAPRGGVCIACGGTGVASRGGRCVPCHGKGKLVNED